MKRSGTRLVTAIGVLLILGAPLLWALSRPDTAAGDVAAVEATLRASTTGTSVVPPTSVDTANPTATTSAPPPPALGGTEVPEPTAGPAVTQAYVPPNLVIDPGPQPVRLRINDIAVDAPVAAYGVDTRTGEMEVPRNITEVAWYRFGATPGEQGSAVLAAHVDLAGEGPGVFFDLGQLEPGNLVTVAMDDGSARYFEVTARQTYEKDELPVDVIFGKQGPAVLTLITCGGGFNSTIGSYDSNVVVYAFPVDVPEPAL